MALGGSLDHGYKPPGVTGGGEGFIEQLFIASEQSQQRVCSMELVTILKIMGQNRFNQPHAERHVLNTCSCMLSDYHAIEME